MTCDERGRRLQCDALALLLRFRLADVALFESAADEEPGRHVEETRRQTHALGGVEDIDGGGKALGFDAAGAFEVSGGALDERHALLEDAIELSGRLETLTEGDGDVPSRKADFSTRYVAHD